MSKRSDELLASSFSMSVTTLPSEIPVATLTAGVKAFVKEYMAKPQYDASHDFNHILRVLALAEHILLAEQKAQPLMLFDPTVVTLASLLHDVEDHKYMTHIAKEENDRGLIKSVLVSLGASVATAAMVQDVVSAVSYSKEIRDPTYTRRMLQKYPELAIVQDADRLDAIGAVGIGRTFTYAGAKGSNGAGMEGPMKHFDDKLLHLEGMMKTEVGKRMARDRTDRLRIFQEWWREETMMSLTNFQTGID